MMEKREKIKEWINFFILLIIIILVKIYIATPVSVDGASMDPTLKDRDYMIENKLIYYFKDIKRGDIVVLKSNGTRLVKRVIGLPGENVIASNGSVYVNGKLLEEPYLKKDIITEDFNMESTIGKKKLDKDEYFVMGDNRPYSSDSRQRGAIKRKDITGRVKLLLFPFTRIGIKK